MGMNTTEENIKNGDTPALSFLGSFPFPSLRVLQIDWSTHEARWEWGWRQAWSRVLGNLSALCRGAATVVTMTVLPSSLFIVFAIWVCSPWGTENGDRSVGSTAFVSFFSLPLFSFLNPSLSPPLSLSSHGLCEPITRSALAVVRGSGWMSLDIVIWMQVLVWCMTDRWWDTDDNDIGLGDKDWWGANDGIGLALALGTIVALVLQLANSEMFERTYIGYAPGLAKSWRDLAFHLVNFPKLGHPWPSMRSWRLR
jgi:hypothetical protein